MHWIWYIVIIGLIVWEIRLILKKEMNENHEN